MSRSMIKSAAATAIHYSGVDRLVARSRGWAQMPLIIGYHRVVEDFHAAATATIPAMLVGVRTLERQLDLIGRQREFVSLDEAAELAVHPRRTRRPVAAITFDDGYRDVYDHAFPLLVRKGIPFGTFVVTGAVGTSRLLAHDRLYALLARCYDLWPRPAVRLGRLLAAGGVAAGHCDAVLANAGTPYAATRALLTRLSQAEVRTLIGALERQVSLPREATGGMGAMTWPMLAAMQRAGVTIGSHTRTHAFLANEGPGTIAAEVAGSRTDLERRLQAPIRHFAYPNGDFNGAVAGAVAKAGYQYAYSICGCRAGAPALSIPRRVLWERSGSDASGGLSGAMLACEVRGVFDIVSGCRRDHGA